MKFIATLSSLLISIQVLLAQNFEHELTQINQLLKAHSSYKEHFSVDTQEHCLVMTTGKYSPSNIATVTIPLEKLKFIEVKVMDKEICGVYLYTERPLNQIAIRSASYKDDTDMILIFVKDEAAAHQMALELAKITAHYNNALLKLNDKDPISVNDLVN